MKKNYTKFGKFKNIYGIKDLVNLDKISKDTIIYAPNGVMKTSFADGLQSITENKPIVDVFENNIPEFEIIQNSKIFSETSNDGSFQCIVFSGKYLKSNIFSNPSMASMAMSASLKEAYQKEISELESIKDELDRICSINIKNGKKKAPNSWLSLTSIVGADNVDTFIGNLLDINKNDSSPYKDLPFNAVCNEKVTSLYKNSDFVDKLKLYREVVEKKMSEDIFNSGFTYSGLVELRDTIDHVHYFEAHHKIVIGNEIIERIDQLNDFLEGQKHILFSSDEVKTAYSEVNDMLNSNASTRAYSKLLMSNFDLLAKDENIIEKQKYVIRSKTIGLEDSLLDLKKRYQKTTLNLMAILDRAKTEESLWKSVRDIFNFRFSLNRTDLEITYVEENGFPVPRIIQMDKKTRKPLNENMIARFSEGEKRALYILNLIFEIESKKLQWHDGILLILDDIADSFDYQNKYAICKYIQELYSNQIFHVITLTHNFDFYRCCSFFLSKLNIAGCFAQRQRRKIKLINGIPKEYLSLSFAQSWKGRLSGPNNSSFENITTFFSLLPILRNEIEIEESISSDNYAKICNLLHRRREVHTENLSSFKEIFDARITENLDLVYYSITYNELIKICFNKLLNSTVEDSKLSSKMASAVLLRIFYEEFILLKSKNEKIVLDEKANEKIDKIYAKLKEDGKLSKDEILHCEFASIICNPYVHVNAFMYEQLIDNPADKIIEFMKYFAEECQFFK